MKKFYFLFIFLISTTFAFAQTEIYGSLGLAKYDEKNYDGHEDTFTGKFGLVFWIPFNDSRFSINPGLAIGNLGTKFEDSGEKTTVTLGYLSAPVDFVYRIKPLGSSFFVSAGGYYGYLISAETEDGELKVNDGNYSYKTSDYGINIGLGYAFEKGLTLRAGYSKGMANILNYPSGVDGHIKNSNLTLSIGYVLFKKRV